MDTVIRGDRMLWLLWACSPPLEGPSLDTEAADTDCVVAAWYLDRDDDGFGDPELAELACEAPARHVSDSADCDDDEAEVHPGALETCDGSDEDCDGVVDDGLSSYLDADLDGHGGVAATIVACDVGADVADDCDDTNRQVNPSEDEICDGIDNDCDGIIDTDALDRLPWYADADADGWGSGDPLYVQCDPVAGLVSQTGDCDDADPALSPDAEEICDNGVDEDCDGGGCVFEGDVVAEGVAAFAILGETEREYLDRLGPLYTASGPGLFVSNDEHLWLFRSPPVGEVYVSAADADIALDAAGTYWTWSSLGDLDGDGVSELAGTGDSTVHFLSATAETGPVADRAAYSVVGPSALRSATHARDADGDGAADFAVGSPGAESVWLVPLGEGGSVSDISFVTVSSGGDHDFGRALDLGDLDGDGLADLAVGAPAWDEWDTAYEDGAVFVFLAPYSGAVDADDADGMDTGADIFKYFGLDVQIESDLDGDGTDDLLVSEYYGWNLYDAPSSSGTLVVRASLSNWSGTVDSADLDGDGAADLMYGPDYLGGGSHVVYGPIPDGVFERSGTITSAEGSPNLYSLGDLDEDGFDDLGALLPSAGTPRAAYAGKMWGLMGSGGF